MFAMLYVAFLTVYEHYVLDEATIAAVSASHAKAAATNSTPAAGPQPGARAASWWWLEPLATVPVLCFAYQTHEVIVPVYACMRDRFIGSFMKASIFGLVILFVLYNLVGAFGYLTFGANVGPDIMSLYDARDPVVVVGVVALVVKFVTTYPPLMFCGRSALDGLYAEVRQLSPTEFKLNEPRRRLVSSTLWFLSTVALAVFAPDISLTLQLLGSMASINVFVFPGMCLVSLTRRLRGARHALLMGELPPDCGLANGPAGQQRAKDYHLISGTYFGAAMKRRQQIQLQQQQQQQLQQQQRMQFSHSLRNQLMSGCGGGGGGGGANSSNHRPQSNGHTSGLGPKHFAATFASLVEFENNLVKSTCSNDDQHLQREHHSLLLLNGNTPGPFLTADLPATNNTKTLLPSAPMASSSSSSGLQLSGSERALASNGKLAHQANYGSLAPVSSGQQQQQQLARSLLRQHEFERLLNNGTGAATSGLGKQNGQSQGCELQLQPQRSCCCCCCCSGTARPSNDSLDDYSDCDDLLANNHCTNRQLNGLADKRLLNQNAKQQQQQQQVFASLSSSFKQFWANNQKMQLDQSLAGADFFWASDRKSTASLLDQSQQQQRQQQQKLQLQQAGGACLNQSSANYAEQSITDSLLNKFGSSIAPSTVAQIGISRCAAMGLYLFAGLLILFGTFIFLLELVSVFGLLQ